MTPTVTTVFEPEYRFLFRDHAGQDILQFVYAGNDREAMTLAKARCQGLAVEIWQERRHVGSLPKVPLIAP